MRNKVPKSPLGIQKCRRGIMRNVPEILTVGAGEDDANDSDHAHSTLEADDGDDDDGGPYISEPLESQFDKNKPADISAAEAQTIISLIRQILRYDPAERPTAHQLLEHEWFK
jgi:serine/threonine protein kinase